MRGVLFGGDCADHIPSPPFFPHDANRAIGGAQLKLIEA
jgi:hypothetical protein